MSKKDVYSMIGSHNARLRCTLIKFFNISDQKDDTTLRKHIKKNRLQNCSILRLDIKDYSFSLQLIYSGEIDPGENKVDYKYWVSQSEANVDLDKKTPSGEPVYYKFQKLTGKINNLMDLADIKTDTELPNFTYNENLNYTFFMIRHGQAEHNVWKKGWHKMGKININKKDTELTQLGKDQGARAGNFFMLYSKINRIPRIHFLFVSDLYRTRQTVEQMLSVLNISSKKNTTYNFIVLPCSHETKFSKNGTCDDSINWAQPFTAENKMSCYNYDNVDDNTVTKCKSFDLKVKNGKNITINIYWGFYINFYKGFRGHGSITEPRFRCRQWSFIELAIIYINYMMNLKIDNDQLIKENINKFNVNDEMHLIDTGEPGLREAVVGGRTRKMKKYSKNKYKKTKKNKTYKRK